MDKAKRKAIIAGNWKMNKTASEAAVLVDELVPAVQDAGCEVVICTPYTDLVTAVEKTKGTNIHVGAENVHFEKSGAFTGEISADMLTDLGVEYVVIGHSERRQYFAETNETVNKRTKAALAGGLKPIICVGESLAQREQGVTEELVRMQVKIALNGVTADDLKNVVIAYEPIWAIGTGNFQPEWFGVPLPPCGCRSCEEPGEILFRKERRDKVHGKEGKCRRGGLLPKRDGEDFFRQEAGCPRSTYDRTVARVF